MFRKATLFLTFLCVTLVETFAQHSVAREWNEVILFGVRNDFARPTVHARNLYHTSVLMYDSWAAYDEGADPFFLGNAHRGFEVPYDGVIAPEDVKAAQEEAMSYAVYRMIKQRFQYSPGAAAIILKADSLIRALGYDPNIITTDYQTQGPAALGNYLAEKMIEFGLQDGSNEEFDYLNFYYTPVNPPLVTDLRGNPDIIDLNRWQPLSLDIFIDQAGNPIPFNTPDFLGPEWGWVVPFSLPDSVASFYDRDDQSYVVFHDPGPPPYLNTEEADSDSELYKWGFSMVSIWQSHLDSKDTTMWDISPASIGNNPPFPDSFEDFPDYYQYLDGGDASQGHTINPVTGSPYTPQMVSRADYARVLAEFWADGPDSETPPGHWFVIMNYVHDHPEFERKYRGSGEIVDDLEWDVKSYFIMGGAMHDCAIAAWSVKGYYDYIRPISALRGMAELGQSSDPNLPNFHPGGLPLIPGYIELVGPEDTSGLFRPVDLNKIKLYTWQGHFFIQDTETDEAGVDWVLAETWWPYQRITFVTPPFAGYVSGHSTFSRAAAEVLTLLTGDRFFPGGMGVFPIKKNEFLVFEDGPSVDFELQWATYQDASDQTSLSRIWGGIHPPADDIPGRKMGEVIGVDAFNFAEQYFNYSGMVTSTQSAVEPDDIRAFPNPVQGNLYLSSDQGRQVSYVLYNQLGQPVRSKSNFFIGSGRAIDLYNLPSGPYWLTITDLQSQEQVIKKIIKGF